MVSMTSLCGGIHIISINKKEGNVHPLKWRVNKTQTHLESVLNRRRVFTGRQEKISINNSSGSSIPSIAVPLFSMLVGCQDTRPGYGSEVVVEGLYNGDAVVGLATAVVEGDEVGVSNHQGIPVFGHGFELKEGFHGNPRQDVHQRAIPLIAVPLFSMLVILQ
ncbi:hypothetical protein RHMOL_RhmolUnG0003200 [Rhododendron molle]|nr:hypothetical protein RHMOL_RhmolUnG0003200 [Rhododendron molle]